MNEKVELINSIVNVFSGISRPDTNEIFEYIDSEDVDYDPETINLFTCYTREEITIDMYNRINAEVLFCYLKPKAFQYFFPYFLIAIIEHPKDTEELGIRDALMRYITPRKSRGDLCDQEKDCDPLYTHIIKRITLFSPDQIRAFQKFLYFMLENFPSTTGETEEDALKAYWEKPPLGY